MFLQLFSPLVAYATINNVCPQGGEWSDHIYPVNGEVNYTAPAGKVVTDVCVKGGSTNSGNGYLETFNSQKPGWFTVSYETNGNPANRQQVTKNCVRAEGLGTANAKALHGDADQNACAGISHSSFRLASVPTPVCSPETNLVSNGSFETPVVMDPTNWQVFEDNTANLAWDVQWFGGSPDFNSITRPDPKLELHKGVNGWTPQEGLQYAELDSDWFGPIDTLNGEPATVTIKQEITTIPGYNYELKYSFSPRPNTPDTDNILNVKWAGSEIGNHSANGVAANNWMEYTKTLEATSSTTDLEFMDHGFPNSLGTFLDNVEIRCIGPIATPTPIPTNAPIPTPTPTLIPTSTPTPILSQCVEGPTWAAQIQAASRGIRNNDTPVLIERSNPENVLGSPDGQFFSLGKNGVLIAKFDNPIVNVTSKMDVSIHEITNGRSTYPEELATVEASLDAQTWYLLGTASNKTDTTGDLSGQGGIGISLFDLETANLPAANYLKITEVSNWEPLELTADGFDLEAIDATYGLCEQTEFIQTSDVMVCKYDSEQNPLRGWNVQLLGSKVETLNVLPDDTLGNITPATSSSLVQDDYVVVARGAYQYRSPGLLTDPGYSQRDASADSGQAYYYGDYLPWVNVTQFTSPYDGALGIKVNDNATNWGYFSPEHKYALGYENYSGTFNFTSIDDNTSDNSGDMLVDIYKGYAGTTGENGCVIFPEVPYGTYVTDEILQMNWENISGKGQEVQVDTKSEVFTLVNQSTGNVLGDDTEVTVTLTPTNTPIPTDTPTPTPTVTLAPTPSTQQLSDLSVEKTSVAGSFLAGNTITYTLKVQNNGTASSFDTVAWDTLPSGTIFLSSNVLGQYVIQEHRIYWMIGEIPAGQSWQTDVTISVDNDIDATVVTLLNRFEAWKKCETNNSANPFLWNAVSPIPTGIVVCDADPTPSDNVATKSLNKASILGLSSIRETIGNVLGASDTLADAGRSISLSIIFGTALISSIIFINKRHAQTSKIAFSICK